MFSSTAQVSPSGLSVFWSVLSVFLCVWLWWIKSKAVVCCLLATSTIILSEKKTRKRKMWSKKWHLKRNISCGAHLLNKSLETDVPWDYVIVVSAGRLRKRWDSLSELRSSLSEKTTVKDSSEACAIDCQNCTVYSVFPSGMTSHSKIAQFNWECTGRTFERTQPTFFPLFPSIDWDVITARSYIWTRTINLISTFPFTK